MIFFSSYIAKGACDDEEKLGPADRQAGDTIAWTFLCKFRIGREMGQKVFFATKTSSSPSEVFHDAFLKNKKIKKIIRGVYSLREEKIIFRGTVPYNPLQMCQLSSELNKNKAV